MLFNKNKNGSLELSSLTGQWYAATPYELIASEIAFATREVSAVVGSPVVDAASKAYAEATDVSMVNAVRLPVAFLALAKYSTLSGVSHEGTGRKVKMDDNEKMPFEWMIDRDDRAMRERYYRALDSLFDYLITNSTESWVASGKSASLSDSIVKNISQFESVYPIGGSYYVYYMLQNLVIEAQRTEVKPFFGESPWSDVISDTPDERLAPMARTYAILRAVATAGTRWSLEIFPLEIARRFSPSYQGNKASQAAVTSEIEWYLKGIEKQITAVKHQIRLAIDGDVDEPLLPKNDPANKYFTTL